LDDEELSTALTLAVAGDEAGFAALWRLLHPALLRYLRLLAGDAAEDVASETWLQTVRDLPGFTGDAMAFRAWLFRVARNRGIDEQRRARRRKEDPTADWDDSRHGPDAATEAVERSDTAWALGLIASLPRDQAEAVMLRAVAGLDAVHAGAVLGKRPGAVRIAAMRGLRRLADDVEVRVRHRARTRSTGGDAGTIDSARLDGV
jgi:RNA polymerase sigma-70 factor (ECF subfamily)